MDGIFYQFVKDFRFLIIQQEIKKNLEILVNVLRWLKFEKKMEKDKCKPMHFQSGKGE